MTLQKKDSKYKNILWVQNVTETLNWGMLGLSVSGGGGAFHTQFPCQNW
jgi:hypothetical protein